MINDDPNVGEIVTINYELEQFRCKFVGIGKVERRTRTSTDVEVYYVRILRIIEMRNLLWKANDVKVFKPEYLELSVLARS